MRSLARIAIFLVLLCGIDSLTRSAILAQDAKGTGTITGRVLLDGKPAQRVIVLATPSVTDPARIVEQMLKPAASLKAATDSDGRYRFEALPAGKYNIMPSAPTLVSTEPDAFAKQLNITEGAAIEGIDFSLSRGGVMTGKITDSEGRPVITEEISLKLVAGTKAADSYSGQGGRMYYTDDRGVYRIYALAPGRYIVSAGGSQDSMSFLAKRPKRVQTYYPGVTDESRSKPVEVIAGAEASGVDIKVGMADKGSSVNGRVLIAETGAPIANAMVAYTTRPSEGSLEQSNREDSFSVPGGMTTTNAKGEFRLDSVEPGNYKLEVQSMGALTGTSTNDFYADPVNFEVQSGNIDKLVIKVHLGASISGVVGFESPAAEAFDTSTPFMLIAVPDERTKSTASGMARVAADGSFRIGGLKAGKINIRSLPYGAQKFSVVRIERNGVEQFDGLDIQPNEQITGVRVVVVQANCILHGRVTIQGGTLTPDSEISVWARPLHSTINDSHRTFPVDAKGNFVIEGLAPGDYEVEASVSSQGSGTGRRVSAKQQVTLTPGTPAQTSLILDLGAKGPDK
ncbi:MAG: carboxypeptidase-like regulatory domain-containing protein [Acidobacteriota bacterium]